MTVALGAPSFAQDAPADLYKQNCSICHGEDGKGATPAGQAFKVPSFKDPAVVKVSDADRTAIIKNGKNQMQKFADRLSAEQIKSVVTYLRTLEK